MSNRQYLVVSATIFTLVCIAHVFRAIGGAPVQVGEYAMPMYVSWIAAVVAGGLAISAAHVLRQASD